MGVQKVSRQGVNGVRVEGYAPVEGSTRPAKPVEGFRAPVMCVSPRALHPRSFIINIIIPLDFKSVPSISSPIVAARRGK